MARYQSSGWGGATVWAVGMVVCSWAGCGADGSTRGDASTRSSSEPSGFSMMLERDLMTVPRAALEAETGRLEERARRGEATAEAVQDLRMVARIARVMALREEDGEWLERARRSLREAARRKALAGACEAAIEWAELEARDAGALEQAYAIAYRTTRRFERLSGQEACLGRARRIRRILSGYRPGAGALAVIDADPDAHDPSVARAEEEVDPWAVWAEAEGGDGPVELGAISLYGLPEVGAETVSVGAIRCVLNFDQVTSFSAGEEATEGGRRYYFDMARVRPAPELAAEREIGRGGIVRVGWERGDSGALRAYIDVAQEMRSSRFALTDPYRLVLDLEPARASNDEREGNNSGDVDLIVLDPGHGGLDYGARYEGLKESHLALDIARRVNERLRRRLPHAQVVMTRTRDVMVGLEERIAFANSIQADLFVSIHLNAADEEVRHGGVATFVLDTDNDRQAMRLAARENGTSASEVTGMQRILAGLHRDDQVTASRSAARLVQRATLVAGRRIIPDLPDRGVKSAMFYVLVGARMPAILVEASFINQPQEARHLRTERYRQTLAEGIADGVVRYARQ